MIYLHIGFHKSGSSTIQRFAGQNKALFARNNLIYPEIGRSGENHFKLMNETRRAKGTQLIEQVARLAEENKDKGIVISAEGLNALPPEKVVQFVEPLRNVSPVQVLLYVRSVAGRLVSSYNQTTKRSYNILPFDKYFKRQTRGRDREQVILKWGNAVGFDALRVRTLDKSALVGGDLLTDFCAALGMKEGAIAEANPESLRSANVAVPWEAAEFIREFGIRASKMIDDLEPAQRERFDREVARSGKIVETNRDAGRRDRRNTLRPTKFADVCVAALGSIGSTGKAQYLTVAQSEQLEEEYQAQLAAISARVSNARLDYTPPPPLPERPFEPSFEEVSPNRREAMRLAVQQHYGWNETKPNLQALIEGMRETSAPSITFI